VNKEDIKKLRDRLDLSQSEFAVLVYVNYHTISKWEKGLAKPRRGSDAKMKELWLQGFGSVYLADDTKE
jgi:DNA-binding transcriptional regulator YiaG